ncbi:MAG: XRE family transcriptional regulator [Actinobacteria bacterium]|nr:XRE family transcriptional regulator [Actinomycetota bacterium]
MLFREALGVALRERRGAAALSLRDVAKQAGVSLGYLSEVERGHKEMSSELLTAVCGALDADVRDLIRAAADGMCPPVAARPLTVVPQRTSSASGPIAAA